MTVPMLDEMIQLSAADGRARGRARHGPPRPAQRARPQPRPRLRDDLPRVRGRLLDRGRDHDPAGRHRRRQVPPRRPGHLPARGRRLDHRPAGVQPEPPRVRLARWWRAPRAPSRPRAQGPHALLDTNAAIPIILHGDAALPGQGVVSETLNLQALDGYTVGGTLHIIQNNQVGFTTDPDDSRSTRWASDIAKGFDVPIIHVNADDVEACVVRRPAGLRVPPGVRPRRDDRPHRLPPLRPQRGRRAGLHAARDGRDHQGQDAGARALRRPARRAGRDDQGGDRRAGRGDLGLAVAPPQGAQGGARGRPAPSSRPAATSSTARPRPRSRPRSTPSACAASTTTCCACPRASRSIPKLVKQLERRRETLGRRRRHRLGAGRGARLRLAADRGHAGPPDRPGLRARHVLPAPPRAARRQDRPADLADPEPAGRAGADGAAQLAAVGDRLPRLRVRLLDGGAGDARAVGGPVRRLRQLGAGDRRPVHRLGAVQVGADHAPDAAAAARLRGLGPRALLGAARALPDPRRRGQHPRREPDDAGPVLPPAAPPGARRQAAPAGDHDPEVAAAPAAGDVADRAPRPSRASSRC